MSKVSKDFRETIKNYLEERAAQDELFAVTYKKENKNIDECCNYVISCAKREGAVGYSDAEVFGWAIHYYDEDDIKNIKPESARVVVNRSVELTDEDKAKAKQKAIDSLVDDYKEEAKKELAESIELTPEEITEAKKLAISKAVEFEREKIMTKATKKKASAVPEESNDLFSM